MARVDVICSQQANLRVTQNLVFCAHVNCCRREAAGVSAIPGHRAVPGSWPVLSAGPARQALGGAAMRLAVERGLENVFVEDIAAAAEVSPRTFNNYFASKYEAICALALDRSFQIGEALRERPASESLWDAVRNAVLAVYGSASEAPDHQVIARIQLVTCSPVLRGEYLKALSMMQYELAEAITERTGAVAAADTFFTRAFAGAITAVVRAPPDHGCSAHPPAAPARATEAAGRGVAEDMLVALPKAAAPKNGEPPM